MAKKITVNKDNLEKERQAKFIQARLNNAVLTEKERLEDEGYEVPSTSLSVKGDNREVWRPEKYFAKFYMGLLDTIAEEYGLSIEEYGIILLLSKYLNFESNLLCDEKGNPLRRKDLEEILGCGHNAVDKYMKLLVEKGVFAKTKVKNSTHYYMNPYIFYMGNRIDNTLVSIFKNYTYSD